MSVLATEALHTAMHAPSDLLGQVVVTDALVAALPPVVQRYLRFAQVIGQPVPRTIQLHQRGTMRLKPGGRWSPFTARQLYTTNPPGFVWRATLKLLSVWPVKARDSFVDGHGHMEVWPLPFLKVVDARGPELDQGELLRFLAELPWYPAAAVLPYLQWEAVDDQTARVTLTVGELQAAACFQFATDGAVAALTAERYWLVDKGPARLTPWSCTLTAYQDVAGLRLPSQGEAIWQLPEGNYSYFRARVSAIAYDRPGGKSGDGASAKSTAQR